MDIPFNFLIKQFKKLSETVNYIFGNIKFEPRLISFDELNKHMCFSINICNNKNVKMYAKNIRITIKDEYGNTEYRRIFRLLSSEKVGNNTHNKCEQFSSCTIADRDIYVAKRLMINDVTKDYIKDKKLYIEYENHINKTKQIEVKIEENLVKF